MNESFAVHKPDAILRRVQRGRGVRPAPGSPSKRRSLPNGHSHVFVAMFRSAEASPNLILVDCQSRDGTGRSEVDNDMSRLGRHGGETYHIPLPPTVASPVREISPQPVLALCALRFEQRRFGMRFSSLTWLSGFCACVTCLDPGGNHSGSEAAHVNVAFWVQP
jgi:hypothetical protein